jgi:hypothetical protein
VFKYNLKFKSVKYANYSLARKHCSITTTLVKTFFSSMSTNVRQLRLVLVSLFVKIALVRDSVFKHGLKGWRFRFMRIHRGRHSMLLVLLVQLIPCILAVHCLPAITKSLLLVIKHLPVRSLDSRI